VARMSASPATVTRARRFTVATMWLKVFIWALPFAGGDPLADEKQCSASCGKCTCIGAVNPEHHSKPRCSQRFYFFTTFCYSSRCSQAILFPGPVTLNARRLSCLSVLLAAGDGDGVGSVIL